MRDEISALTVERLDYWLSGLFKQAGGKATGKPLKIERPAEPARKRRKATAKEIAVLFGQFK